MTHLIFEDVSLYKLLRAACSLKYNGESLFRKGQGIYIDLDPNHKIKLANVIKGVEICPECLSSSKIQMKLLTDQLGEL